MQTTLTESTAFPPPDLQRDVLREAACILHATQMDQWQHLLNSIRHDHLPASALIGVEPAEREQSKSEHRDWTRTAAKWLGQTVRRYEACRAMIEATYAAQFPTEAAV
jgi:hypothetical protein